MLALSAPEGWTKCLEAPATHRVAEFLIVVRNTALLDILDNMKEVR
jgi:hypothetical protein